MHNLGGNYVNRLKFGIISLGCDKNRIDTETVIGKLHNKYELVNNPKEADIILVNTCGFIESSKQESINTILEMAEYKTKYNCKVLVVTGCLSQRYKEELLELMPEIDIMLGVNNYDKLMDGIEKFLEEKNKQLYVEYSDDSMNEGSRILTTPSATAYLRISEGCNNFCTYCIIPKIRGKYRSRKIEAIVEEAEALASQGVKELIIVAQDTTMYGIDLYGQKSLPKLLAQLSYIDNIKWIRLLYTYPEEITDELIEEIANNDKVCKYLDMPIQHISNTVLKRMNRRGTKELVLDNINKLRNSIPDIALRTSIIVGFPGETEEEFAELTDFIKEIKFDKLGVFRYSQEEGTPAANLKEQIPEEVKLEREKVLMSLQQKISKNINESKIDKVYEVLVEGKENGTYFGRNFEMAPEIDGIIYFTCDTIINKGDLVQVKITKALEYDLIGVVYHEFGK
jgi:ribosomal protein S12 methylthiotransferase